MGTLDIIAYNSSTTTPIRTVEYLLLLKFQCASDAMSNFLVTTIINVFSSSRFSGHEKNGPMSPYGDYNKERVKIF